MDAATGQQSLFLSLQASSLTSLDARRQGLLVLCVIAHRISRLADRPSSPTPEESWIPVTRDTNNYSDLSVAANGQVLATCSAKADGIFP